ncbi:PilZ domain-containing protein [Thalassotalea aquiviva]|uniref:PilZ domain-containing protein n=1 Tax=Thalassotalea aquiviva TaxID=3242415 RepID=UPI00352B567D
MNPTYHEILERRKHFRIDMENETVEMFWRDSEGQAHQLECQCIDFSRKGLKIEHDFAIEVDTPVSIRFQTNHPNSKDINAKVVRCLENVDGKFSIGFEIL